jgi:hypothetical protein
MCEIYRNGFSEYSKILKHLNITICRLIKTIRSVSIDIYDVIFDHLSKILILIIVRGFLSLLKSCDKAHKLFLFGCVAVSRFYILICLV